MTPAQRTAWLAEVTEIVAAHPPRPRHRLWYVYRVYGPDDVLLYGGATGRLGQRTAAHLADAPFATYVRRIDVDRMPDRRTMLATERRMIRDLRPLFNTYLTGHRPGDRPRVIDAGLAQLVAS